MDTGAEADLSAVLCRPLSRARCKEKRVVAVVVAVAVVVVAKYDEEERRGEERRGLAPQSDRERQGKEKRQQHQKEGNYEEILNRLFSRLCVHI